MTDTQVSRYIELVRRRAEILTCAGIQWKPEYAGEMERIDAELAVLKPMTEAARAEKEEKAGRRNVPIMWTIKQASQNTGLSYDFIRKLCLQDKIVHVKAGRKYFVNSEKLVEFLDTGNMEGAGCLNNQKTHM